MTSRVILSMRVAATPTRAFDVFTAEIGEWWRPDALFAFTPRDPGRLSFENQDRLIETLPNGEVFEIGVVSRWEPPRRLVFTWRQATFSPHQTTEVRVHFEPTGAETRVTIEHLGWDGVPTAHVARHGMDDIVFLRRHGEWWRDLLSSYKAAL